MSSDTPHRWDELNQEQKRKVERYIATLLAQQQPLLPPKPKAGREVVERRQQGSVYYQLERVKCGKKKCKCASGALHGPYWYAYWREGKRMKSKYLGKEIKPVPESEPASYVAGAGTSGGAGNIRQAALPLPHQPTQPPATQPNSHQPTEPPSQIATSPPSHPAK